MFHTGYHPADIAPVSFGFPPMTTAQSLEPHLWHRLGASGQIVYPTGRSPTN
jgi:hypothetical protein